MSTSSEYSIWAVKAVQPGAEGAGWIPKIYRELKAGRARFGWGWIDLRELDRKGRSGKSRLSATEKDNWRHASFLLSVDAGSYFVYINMPEYGKCTLVRITGRYEFGEVWAEEDDFRNALPCKYIATFDRNDDRVPPYLKRRLKLPGARYQIYCKEEFEELLEALEKGKAGRTARVRLNELVSSHLCQIAEETHKQFPEKSLEPFLVEVFNRMPSVVTARKGPDTNGADIELEFESARGLGTLERPQFCAVQAKSYSGTMGYDRAIRDIERAFRSNPAYTCGLIVSTALELTEDFEKKLHHLEEKTGKDVGVLIGRDLAQIIIAHGFSEEGTMA